MYIFKLCPAIWHNFVHLKIGLSTHNWMYVRKKNFHVFCTFVIYGWPRASALWVPSALSSSPAAYCSDYRLWIVTMAEYELWAAFLNRTLKIMLSFLNSFERVGASIWCAAARKPSSRFVLGSRFLPSDSLKKLTKNYCLFNII